MRQIAPTHGGFRSQLGPVIGDGAQRQRTARLDLGLALLARRCKPGEQLTCDDIAAWTGTSNVSIWQIEQRALRKLKRAVMRSDPTLMELIEACLLRHERSVASRS